MESAEDRRCRRNDGASWRCGQTAADGEGYCEKHLAQFANQKERFQREKGDATKSKKKKMTATATPMTTPTPRKRTRERRIKVSHGTDSDASESESEMVLASFRQKKSTRPVRAKEDEAKSRRSVKSDEQEGNSTKKVGLSFQFEENGDKCRKSKESGSLMCHQCQRNNKSGVVHCSKCGRKRYCFECLERWYPGKTREEVQTSCPFCCGNCNCKACMREVPVVKVVSPCLTLKAIQHFVLRLQYLLYKAIPVLRHIYREQSSELEIEAKIKGSGVQMTENNVERIKLDKIERLYW
ncbi:hypothetical protein TIFTF001_012105 [Ficus carica]|uniref:Uncharacterized protein n=1 Tax=Ficus carica TaxID=3494 RepID=A0AA87ZVF0_FICCA|nr:hypothetical protein TIFTF001_012105 [Ficus carica]